MSEELAPHTARNWQPISDVLRIEFASIRDVLELGSGNGQHATLFAAAMRHLRWQTSDLDESHAAINRWLTQEKAPNVLAPLALDVMTATLPANTYDAVFSANTAHIMSLPAVEKMFALVARAVRAGGVFCLYGAFRQGGIYNAESNARFHATLRARNASMGIRDLEELDAFAAAGGLQQLRCYAMPANNLLVVWSKALGELQ